MPASQLVRTAPTPAPAAVAPTASPLVRRPTSVPTSPPQPPVIISSASPPVAAQPARVVSDNWSGYVAEGGDLWQGSGSWTDPTVSCTPATAESVLSVGLGRYPRHPLHHADHPSLSPNPP